MIKNRIHRYKYGVPLRKNFIAHENDLMIVSYPKSGNTWVRSIFASHLRDSFNIGEMDRLVPDIYTTPEHVLKSAPRIDGWRIVKSHESFRPDYRNVIYIYRDPRDVMISYYYYLAMRKTLDPERTSLAAFCERFVSRSREGAFDSFACWHDHVASWRRFGDTLNILFLKYEDMLADPAAVVRSMFSGFGIEADATQIARLCERTAIGQLRALEHASKAGWRETRRAGPEESFFRAGTAGQWRPLDRDIFYPLEEAWAGLMEELGYPLAGV